MILTVVVALLTTYCVPRECGDDPLTAPCKTHFVVVFPASAGMIPVDVLGDSGGLGVPRECGDDPSNLESRLGNGKCSPRVRG